MTRASSRLTWWASGGDMIRNGQPMDQDAAATHSDFLTEMAMASEDVAVIEFARDEIGQMIEASRVARQWLRAA